MRREETEHVVRRSGGQAVPGEDGAPGKTICQIFLLPLDKLASCKKGQAATISPFLVVSVSSVMVRNLALIPAEA